MSRRISCIPALVAVLLAFVTATSRATAADSLSLYITFHPGPQRITVTLASGAPVGTTSGAPTVIAPGLYNLSFDDSAAVEGPKFELHGPGVSVSEDMFYGEIPSATWRPGCTRSTSTTSARRAASRSRRSSGRDRAHRRRLQGHARKDDQPQGGAVDVLHARRQEELLHRRRVMTFSRRAFVKGGGALIVGVSLAGKTSTAVSAFASDPPTDLGQVDSFIAIHADNTASIKTGRVEVGQGTTTGLLLLVAEELDLDIGRLTFVRHDTSVTPNTGGTLGSSSIALAGPRLRSAAATARQALLGAASTRLGVPVASLTVRNGVVSGGGGSVTYGELVGDRPFNVTMAAPVVDPGVAPSKPVASYALVGRARVPRVDIPAKVDGTFTYVHGIQCRGCSTAGSCGRSARAPTATAPRTEFSRSTNVRSTASATRVSCAAATSSESWRRASSMPSRRRPR